MDDLKIEKWRKNFTEEVTRLQIEYDALFLKGDLKEHYSLNLEEHYSLNTETNSQSLSLEILSKEQLPREIEDRLVEIFIKTKPEDSK